MIPAIGAGEKASQRVYTEEAAKQTAEQLNRYVLRNTSPTMYVLATSNDGPVVGPFYARRASDRSKLEGHAMGSTHRGHRSTCGGCSTNGQTGRRENKRLTSPVNSARLVKFGGDCVPHKHTHQRYA